ncbi:MAG: hypothetical protein AAB551_01445 [Patescibacteria group bacterium]
MICTSCTKEFQILPEDILLYQKCEIPEPTECFDCRQQHLMMFINHINLYKRICDVTGEQIISNYSQEKPYKIYKMEYWHSDKWDAKDYAQDFDFNRPFFEQFYELALKVPRPALFTAYQYDENSAYTNHSGKNKNCYMIFDSDESRDSYYSYSMNSGIDCCDLYRSGKSELCYECIDSISCHHSSFLQNCAQCRDSAFLYDCIGCNNCFMCVNLHHKEYFYKNEFVGKEKYEELIKSLTSRNRVEEYKKEFAEFRKKFPERYLKIYKSEDSIGNYLVNCKNAYCCFDGNDLWDCRYVTQGFMPLKDCIDTAECGGGELIAMSVTAGYNATKITYCQQTLEQISECSYSAFCQSSSNLFGCVGLKRKKFHILNKEYSPEEYKIMVEKIKEHMKRTGEFGKYFPKQIAPFAYNESLAQQWYPLTKEMALQKGFQWKNEEDIATIQEKKSPPENLSEGSEKTLNEVFSCTSCNKKFKIIKEEFEFYKKIGMALPEKCFKCRHAHRVSMRNPRIFMWRPCDACGKNTITNLSKETATTMYCEECYLKARD